MDDPVWNHSTFSNNRDRLVSGNVDERLFEAIKKQAYARQLMSRDHFRVDGTLLEACASLKSFRPRDDSDDIVFTESSHDRWKQPTATIEPSCKIHKR